MNDFIRDEIWRGKSPKHEVVIARDGEGGPIAGYAAWKYASHRWTTGPRPSSLEAPRLIRILWFALDVPYQQGGGDGWTAGDFYASVESRALRGELANPQMIVEAFCDHRNEHALKFWDRQGFTDIGPAFGREEIRRLLRFATVAEAGV